MPCIGLASEFNLHLLDSQALSPTCCCRILTLCCLLLSQWELQLSINSGVGHGPRLAVGQGRCLGCGMDSTHARHAVDALRKAFEQGLGMRRACRVLQTCNVRNRGERGEAAELGMGHCRSRYTRQPIVLQRSASPPKRLARHLRCQHYLQGQAQGRRTVVWLPSVGSGRDSPRCTSMYCTFAGHGQAAAKASPNDDGPGCSRSSGRRTPSLAGDISRPTSP